MAAKLTLILFIISISMTHAQNNISYGIKLGAIFSQQKFDWKIHPSPPFAVQDLTGFFDRRPGPQVGIFVDLLDLSFFTLQVESNYHQRGAQRDFEIRTSQGPEGTGEFITVDELLEYIGLKTTAKFTYNLVAIKPFVAGGTTLSFLLKDKSPSLFVPGEMKNILPGMTIGGGVEFPGIVASGLLFEINFEFDLADAASNDNLTMKHRLWQFLIGIRLK